MPFAYPTPSLIKAAIVERVTMGETVKAICAEPGMPTAASVQVWRRADAAFAEALRLARLRSDFRRRMAFDPVKAEAFLVRVRAGDRIRDLLARPGMPSQHTYTYWTRMEASFQEELWRLKQMRNADRVRRLEGRFRVFDQAVADRIQLRVMRGEVLRRMLETDPTLPCRAVVHRWRKERPDWDGALKTAFRWGRHARGRTPPMRTPELTDKIVAGIVTGGSLRSVAREPGMPAAGTLYGWVKRDADFAAEVAQACDWREDWYLDQMEIILDEAGPMTGKALRQQLAPLRTQYARLQNRPGRKWRGEG